MTETASLYLVTPVVSDAEAFAPLLSAACAAGQVAALQLRLAPDDERTLINRIKLLAPLAQAHGAAVLVDVDPKVATRGGADGVHLHKQTEEAVAGAVKTLQPSRIVGVSGLKLRHDAMLAGEANVDYVMFGEPGYEDMPADPAATLEWAEWWAGLFATPCVACAGSMDEVVPLAATGAEFVALGPWAFTGDVAATVREALEIMAKIEAPSA